MKLKKLISVMLIGACVCSMAACGSKKEEKKIESADDLKDAKIGVQTGTTGDIYCSDDFGDDHVERFNKGADAVQALVKGKIDAVVIDNEPAKAFVDANDGLKILETPYVEEDYAMCFKKGNTELEDKFNAAIKELKEDGTFDKIVGYYIDGTEEKGYESPADVDHSNGKLVMATNAAFEPYEYYEDKKAIIGDLTVNVIKTSHDAEESIGFVLTNNNSSMVYITDTGYINQKYFKILSNNNLYVLESNHDIKMLMDGPYPYYLQQRVRGDKGHLSNKQASDYLCKFIGDNTRKIVFAHISEHNNSYEKVIETFNEELSKNDMKFDDVLIAKQNEATEVIEV